MSDRKLRIWQQAGLIDLATADAIRTWETAHARPLAQWAAAGIGALAIGLGLISLIAANWDAIPGTLRLAIHFAVMIATFAGLALNAPALASRNPGWLDAALFVFAMLGLTFLGHLGQVYQTGSPLWQPLALCLVLFAPVLIGLGQGWLSASALMVLLIACLWSHVTSAENGASGAYSIRTTIRLAGEVAAPALVVGLAGWQGASTARPDFWHRLGQLALAYAVGGASLWTIFAAVENMADHAHAAELVAALVTQAAIGLGAALIALRVQPAPAGRATACILAAAALACPLAYVVSGSQVGAALAFMGLWGGIAAAALYAGWRGVFQQAVALIALRLIVLSFELGGNLLTSGAGLIASGLLILGIAWAAMRISRRYAPASASAA